MMIKKSGVPSYFLLNLKQDKKGENNEKRNGNGNEENRRGDDHQRKTGGNLPAAGEAVYPLSLAEQAHLPKGD